MIIRPFTLAALCVALTACGGDDIAQEATDKATSELAKVAEELGADSEELEGVVGEIAKAFLGTGENVETVSTESLRDMLPKSLLGMERVSLSANKGGLGGIKVTNADAEYEGSNASEKLLVSIADLGSIQGVAKLGMSWVEADTYEENRDGFKRTIEYRGHRGFEEFSTAGGTSRGNRKIIIDGRFVIDVTSANLPFEKIEQVFDGLPVDEFEKMAGS